MDTYTLLDLLTSRLSAQSTGNNRLESRESVLCPYNVRMCHDIEGCLLLQLPIVLTRHLSGTSRQELGSTSVAFIAPRN